jgi:hypothetical protein
VIRCWPLLSAKGEHCEDRLAGYTGWVHADEDAGLLDLYRTSDIREVACLAARHWSKDDGARRTRHAFVRGACVRVRFDRKYV